MHEETFEGTKGVIIRPWWSQSCEFTTTISAY